MNDRPAHDPQKHVEQTKDRVCVLICSLHQHLYIDVNKIKWSNGFVL